MHVGKLREFADAILLTFIWLIFHLDHYFLVSSQKSWRWGCELTNEVWQTVKKLDKRHQRPIFGYKLQKQQRTRDEILPRILSFKLKWKTSLLFGQFCKPVKGKNKWPCWVGVKKTREIRVKMEKNWGGDWNRDELKRGRWKPQRKMLRILVGTDLHW